MKRKRVEVSVEPGPIVQTYEPPEIAALVQRWLDVFGQDRFGVNARRYMWHVFSYERFPSLSGQAATQAYQQHGAAEYIVLSNERDRAFTTRTKPLACSLRDWLVFPPNLAWTMAFTHEDGYIGPYFARSPSYATAHAENLAALRKAEAAEAARSKGWC